MARQINYQLEKIIDQPVKVLDKGFVCLVDYMGSDARIAEAARVSYNSGKTLRDDEKLIEYLFKNGHTSPFEQVVFLFHIKMPLFVARQWIRHRTARLNEISSRYSVMKEEFYLPNISDLRVQDHKNRQASAEIPLPKEDAEEVQKMLSDAQEKTYKDYRYFIEKKLAREMARINLPLSLYTELYWQIDLHNLFNFVYLRLSSHAQKEIREYATVILSICHTACPIATAAFKEYKLNAKSVSSQDVAKIINIIEQNSKNLKKDEMQGIEELLIKLKIKN